MTIMKYLHFILILPSIFHCFAKYIIISVKHFVENPNKKNFDFNWEPIGNNKRWEEVLANIRCFFLSFPLFTQFLCGNFSVLLNPGFESAFQTLHNKFFFLFALRQNYYLPKSKFPLLIYLIFFVVWLHCITDTL